MIKIWQNKLEQSQKSLLIYLALLSLVFVFGMATILSIFFFLIAENSLLKDKIQYQNTKICVGRYIVGELYQIESKFFRISMTDSHSGRGFLKDELEENLENVKHALYVLQNGGEIRQKLHLNIVGASQSEAVIKVSRPFGRESIFEIIEITPKIDHIKRSLESAMKLYDERDIYMESKDGEKITETRPKITAFLKIEPAVIARMTENANRLLYESISELRLLEEELKQKKELYTSLMVWSVVIIALLSALIFVLIAYRIFGINRRLEERIKEEVDKNRDADLLIFEQNRRASVFELLINIAHQWRQPLNVISIVLYEIKDMIKEKDINEEIMMESSQKALDQVKKISSVISNFTNFYERQNQETEFGIKKAIETAISFFGDIFEKEGIKTAVDGVDERAIFGPKSEMVEIFVSMLQNVRDIKLSRTLESVVVNITCESENNGIRVVIKDDCGGIDQKILPNIFDPYSTTAFKSHNKGLGLFNVKNIIEYKFHGKISAINSGKSATFSIFIPSETERR